MAFARTYQRGGKQSKPGGGTGKPLRKIAPKVKGATRKGASRVDKDDDALLDLAWKKVNRHLGDVAEDPDHDSIKQHAYTLAHDAIMDAGYSADTAKRIAMKVKALA